jgi:LPS-assembly protein
VGNVIILHFDNSIYGEKADLNFNTGEVVVEGNVRYVGSGLTVYGSRLYYNMKTKKMNIESARVISESYTILGKSLSQVGEGQFEGEEAEYTTCRDCPESWSIYGKKISITQNEYIRIKHGYLKIKGVIAFYFPYLIFPIKKERESGILFPRIGFDFADGIRFQQPYYHVLGDKSDVTVTPSTWGKRGFGGQIEHRYFASENNWYLLETLFADDKVYEPFKDPITLSGDSEFRHFTTWEHHFTKGLWFNHHFKFTDPSDLDLIRDFDFYTLGKLQGSEVGGETFFDFRLPTVSASIFTGYYQNLLFDQPQELDHRYVQVQPEVDLSLMPLRLFHSEDFFIRNAFFTFNSTFTNFKQNHISELNLIRNSHRYHLFPKINVNFKPIGPMKFTSNAAYDAQRYSFRNGDEKFSKSVIRYENELSFEVDKIFGFSYQTELPAEKVIDAEEELESAEKTKVIEQQKFDNVVGHLNLFGVNKTQDNIKIVSNSYRHRQIFRFKHLMLSDIKNEGNDQFLSQIQNIEGQFDRRDALRAEEFRNNEESSITIPLINTLEFRWENSIIRKRPILERNQNPSNRLIDEFSYNRIGFFNVSQAYDLDSDSGNIRNRLTRLLVETGLNLEKFSFRIREYYFYDSQEHILNTGIGLNYPFFRFNLGYIYNTETDPIRKLVNFAAYINLFSRVELNTNYEYDIELRTIPRSTYNFIYSPTNDCWKFNINYQKNLIEGRLSFNFLIKFNDQNFSSLSDIY